MRANTRQLFAFFAEKAPRLFRRHLFRLMRDVGCAAHAFLFLSISGAALRPFFSRRLTSGDFTGPLSNIGRFYFRDDDDASRKSAR